MRQLPLVLLLACGTPDGGETGEVVHSDTAAPSDTASDPVHGFIGSPCQSDADCDYTAGVCLLASEGFPRGSCSAPCSVYCGDAPGHPVTWCADTTELPEAAHLGPGACVSRCDFLHFPAGAGDASPGCRENYGCTEVGRYGEDTSNYACLPNRPHQLSDCYLELSARGVAFEPRLEPAASPADHPQLVCEVEDAAYLFSPVHDVRLVRDGVETLRQLGACEMLHSATDTIDDVAAHGVVALHHLGTYDCRTVAGTSTLSQHAHGRALDISGFEFADGTTWTLLDHWEHDTEAPTTEAGVWLKEAPYRWYDANYWNILLTPDYNVAHDDHFHVDLTPDGDFIGLEGGAGGGASEFLTHVGPSMAPTSRAHTCAY